MTYTEGGYGTKGVPSRKVSQDDIEAVRTVLEWVRVQDRASGSVAGHNARRGKEAFDRLEARLHAAEELSQNTGRELNRVEAELIAAEEERDRRANISERELADYEAEGAALRFSERESDVLTGNAVALHAEAVRARNAAEAECNKRVIMESRAVETHALKQIHSLEAELDRLRAIVKLYLGARAEGWYEDASGWDAIDDEARAALTSSTQEEPDARGQLSQNKD